MGNSNNQSPWKAFNIMVCGASGTGKTSFIDLFIAKVDVNRAAEITDFNFEHGHIKDPTQSFTVKTVVNHN